MLRNIINAISSATRALFSDWKTAIVFVALYAAFVFSLYLFFTTPEARMWQVALTFLLLLIIPILFFVLQAMGVNYTDSETKFNDLLKQAGRNFWKLLLISLPFIALIWFLVWGVNKLEFISVTGIREAAMSSEQTKAGEERIKLIKTVATTVNGLLLYFILPLLSIQLWIAVLRDGFKRTLKGIGRVLLRAFAPRVVMTYLLGFLVFGVLPYFILTTRTPLKSPWMDLSVLGIRIALALLVILIGWMVTLGAMKILTAKETKDAELPQAETA
jgi:hypothetical protein